jgi:hypothetical protein
MRALKFILIIIALSMLVPSYALADLGAVYTTLIERDVYIYSEEAGEWRALRANYPLWAGDSLWAAEGARAEISIRGGTYVRMDAGTLLEVLEIEDGHARLFIEEGRVYINNERSAYEYVQIDSDYASVRVPEGAVVMFDVASSGAASVSVLKGYAHVQSTSGSVRVNAGSTVHVGYDLYADLTPLGAADEWERWNRARDDRYRDVYASTRYLPDELHEYSYDFDTYGSWVYVSDYGHVWRPSLSVSISVGWAPYKHGRWRWRHGHYVWVSYEPWGWGPYHYGRWAHIGHLGWCWVPPTHGAVYWGPGYVGWVYTSGYVAWVPLAPYEIYYGYGYYGPNSINIIDIDIHKTVVKNVYVNSKVKDAVTVVHHDTFLTGKEKPVKPPKNLFPRGKRGLGPPPDFRPDKKGKPVPRDMEVYKPRDIREMVKPERPERKPGPPDIKERPSVKPEPTIRRKPLEKPVPPGREMEKPAPERKVRPEREGPVRKFEAPARKQPAERPSPPGRDMERRAPELKERPGVQGPPERPERKERVEPPGRGIGPEKRVPSRELKAPERETPQRERERVITPPRPSQSERGRERTVAPPAESTPRRIETTPPGKVETPSPPGRTREAPSPSVAPERRSAPSAPPGPPGWVDMPSSGTKKEAPGPAVSPKGKSAPATPAKPSETSKPSKPSKPTKPSKPPSKSPSKSNVKTVPSDEDAVEMPGTYGQGNRNDKGKDKTRGKK